MFGCVDPSATDESGSPCEGKCDDGSRTLSPALSKLITSAAFLDQIERLDTDAARQFRLGAVSETAVSETATTIVIDVWSASTFQFPATETFAGRLEATPAGVRFVAGGAPQTADELPAELGLVLADPRFVTAARKHPAPAVRDVIVEAGTGEATVVVDVGVAEIVGRVRERVERPASVAWIHAWPQGVVVDETVHAHPSRSFFPGNGYFVFDDREAFEERFWKPFTGRTVDPPVPYIGRNERVVGLVVSYSPYAGKSMKIDRVKVTPSAVEVDVALRWDAFGCFEPIDDVQLVDVLKVPRTDAPVKVNVWMSVGPGCNTGTMLPPPPPPKLEHALVLDGDAHDRFFICDAPGSFRPPFASCAPRDTLAN